MLNVAIKAARAAGAIINRAALDLGLVVAAHGRHVVVETPEGQRVHCHPRGKKSELVVGDRVPWAPAGDEGVIERRVAMLDPERIGAGLTVLAEVTLDRQGDEHLVAFEGRAVADAQVDVWHSSADGFYENQDPAQADMNLRGRFTTNADGEYALVTEKPVSYPVPTDGPGGVLLRAQLRNVRLGVDDYLLDHTDASFHLFLFDPQDDVAPDVQRAVQTLRDDPERFFATVQVVITVVGATAGASRKIAVNRGARE